MFEEEDEAEVGSDDDIYSGTVDYAANLQLIHKTLQGIAAHAEDEGAVGIGRRASTILLGRSLWETPALPDNVEKTIKEPVLKNMFPLADEAIQQARYLIIVLS